MEPMRVIATCYSRQWIRTAAQHLRSKTGTRAFCIRSNSPSPLCVIRGLSGLRSNSTVSSCWYSRTFSVSAKSRRCWSCHAEVSWSELFCPSCTTLQPPDESKDFFQILDCEKSFNVDTQELQRKYRNLQRLLHPDYFSQKSEHERSVSEKQSTLVNKAYNTLLSPLSRGIYLLSLCGITLKEGADDEVETQFLFEILELNEQLNDADTNAEIEEIGSFVQGQLISLTEDTREAFQQEFSKTSPSDL
ncbi:hypothetical protein GDO86_001824 [Hymenochirus boettgeri]|uniref:J domain-containing protein n=1 Tax=Hymenochirus boettgeri TaxID=247094 RepID=A0A8T2KN29_9PIPI|nr:hypothetical protein GDO86_001824 [Hymenochirus boettgeri]